MENCLFKTYDWIEWRSRHFGEDVGGVRFSGYGFNQQAFTEMARGYKDGADYLALSQKDHSGDCNDSLLYPIFFCYRHSVELFLKAIICNLFIPFDRSMSEREIKELRKNIDGHGLIRLFEAIRERMAEKCLMGIFQDKLMSCEPYLKAFDDFDRTSFEMRYPSNKALEPVSCQQEIIGYDINYTRTQFICLWDSLRDLYILTQEYWRRRKFVK